jgi:hypothetical protein
MPRVVTVGLLCSYAADQRILTRPDKGERRRCGEGGIEETRMDDGR